MRSDRSEFYNPEELAKEAGNKISLLESKGEKIDYLALVPDGEPTLDRNLGRLIALLKDRGYPVAVITNSSVLSD